MTITDKYTNAFSEVYEILQHLETSSRAKISSDLLDTIKNNRNKDYTYILDKTKELKDQQMLPETKAILFNIFRDYLASEDQKQAIKKWQFNDCKRLEEEKKKQHNIEIFSNKIPSNNQKSPSIPIIQNKTNTNLMEIKQQTILKALITYIKKIFIKDK